MDNTYQDRSKYIDTIVVLDSILAFVEGCKLCKVNKILDTDHQGYIVDVNLIEYFK